MAKGTKLSRQVNKAVDAMGKGAKLMQMHKMGKLSWYIVPGWEIPEEVATVLKRRPDVISSEDGLFPGIPQTYRMGS